MMDGKDVYRARLEACLAEADAATLPRVKERHLAAARSWQQLLDHVVELERPSVPPVVSATPSNGRADERR